MWYRAPTEPDLRDGDVHVWTVCLDQPEGIVERLDSSLSKDERERVRAFQFERLRRRFIVARGVLRCLLARYLGIQPEHVSLAYGHHGKPSLAPVHGEPQLHFNVSHSEACGLYGITLGREIGVDVERVRPLADGNDVAERFFSTREVAAYRALAPDERLGGFFRCWTRKEAYIKAIGDGLSCPLDSFEVSLGPGEPARVVRIEGDPTGPARWTLATLDPDPACVAALAIEGPIGRLMCWRWTQADLGAIRA